MPNYHRLTIFILFLFPVLCYLPLLHGEYLYDDISHVYKNAFLLEVDTFAKALSFEIQPSRVFSNWGLAIAHLIGKGDVWAHRVLSIFLHALVGIFIYLNICLLEKRLNENTTSKLATPLALLFAISPLLSETVAVATFRWELLGTLFTLISVWIVQHLCFEQPYPRVEKALYGALFLCVGVCFLSKEVYSLFSLSAIILFVIVPEQLNLRECFRPIWRSFFIKVGLIYAFWSAILYWLLLKPSLFPYKGFIGNNVMKWSQQVSYSSQSFLEQIWKTIVGTRLTFLRLNLRDGMGEQWPLLLQIALLITGVGLCIYAWKKGGIYRILGSLFGISTYFYILVPNLNAGSEHYYYFSTIWLLGLLIVVSQGLFKTRAVKTIPLSIVFLCLLGGYYFYQLYFRVDELTSRLKTAQTSLMYYPSSSMAHTQVAAALLELDDRYTEALPYINKARELSPNMFYVHTNQLVYHLRMKQWQKAQETFPALLAAKAPLRDKAMSFYVYGVVALESQRCQEANHALRQAILLDPKYPFLKSEQRRIASHEDCQ